MRQRRAERCVIRAEAALEMGIDDEAVRALEEACRLAPAVTPDLHALRERVERRRHAAAAARRTRKITWSAAAGILLLIAVAGAWAAGMFQPLQPEHAIVPATGAAQPAALGDTDPPVPAGIQDDSAAPAREEPPPHSPEPEHAPAARDRLSVSLDPPTAPVSPMIASDARARPLPAVVRTSDVIREPLALPERSTPAPPLARAPEIEIAGPPPAAPLESGAALPGASVRVAAAPEPPGLRNTPAPPAPSEPAPEAMIRSTLDRYASAFGALDAAAARAVWPGVDERALARAFDGLERQHVSLDTCSITVNGAAARANCLGSATWAPKVGGGTQTESRHWDFSLVNVGGSWQILRATVR